MNRSTLLWLLFCASILVIIGCMSDYVIRPGYNLPPTTRIYTPTDNQSFVAGDTISFTGRGNDREDGILPEDSLVWHSDRDGWLGTGTSFNRNDLTINSHTITLTATDNDGQRDTSMVTIQVDNAQPVKVLFLGSSYFAYNDLPDLFKNLSESGYKNVFVDHYYIGGGYLETHSENPETEAKINSNDWDYVVLQGVGTNMAFPDTHQDIFPPYERHELIGPLRTLLAKIKANRAETRMIYCMPWAFEDGTTWLTGYDDDYFEMQQMIYDNTIIFSDLIPFVIAPVGWAWNSVMKVRTQLHYLFRTDWNHPSNRGSYLMACVLYSTIFQERSSGFTYIDGITAAEATHFQNVGSGIVLNDLELWNIVP